MKIRSALFAVLLIAVAVPAFAQTTVPPPPAPWQHKTQEIIGSLDIANDQASNHTVVSIETSWAYYTSDKTEVGAVVSVIKGRVDAQGNAVDGYGAGPFYMYNLPKLKKGNFYIGGYSQALTGDLLDAAKLQAATIGGYRLYIGKSSAIRIEAFHTAALASNNPDGGQPLNSNGVRVGFSLGVGPGTVVN
jgi:hypothetical protein